MTQPAAIKAAPATSVAAWLAFVEADIERLRGLLVERGQNAEDLRELEAQARVLADQAAAAVAAAKSDIAALERVRNLVTSGQAQPDSGGSVAVRVMTIRPLDNRLAKPPKSKAKKS